MLSEHPYITHEIPIRHPTRYSACAQTGTLRDFPRTCTLILSHYQGNDNSIDDYLELRSRFPDNDSPMWTVFGSDKAAPSFGMDFAFQLQDDLKKFGIPIEMYLGTLDGVSGHIDLLCLSVLEAISRREKLKGKRVHAVASGVAIGNALLDFLCGTILESISFHGLSLPHSFQILIKYRLGLFQNSIKEERVLKHRRVIVALIMAENQGASAREIAKRAGLSASTVTRWMSDGDFMSYVRMFRKHPIRSQD